MSAASTAATIADESTGTAALAGAATAATATAVVSEASLSLRNKRRCPLPQ
jgi:hypothetical protein